MREPVRELTEMEEADRPLRLVLIIGSLSAFAPLSIDMYLPALPSLTRDLHGSPSAVQLTLTACLLGLAFGQVIAGPLSDAMGRRRPLLLGILVYSVASIACSLAPSVPVLVVLRLLQGAGGAAGIVIARAIVRDLYAGTAAARFFALTMLVNGLAPILAPIFGAQLIRVTSWRGVFFVLAAIGVVLLVVTAYGLEETHPAQRWRAGGVRDTIGTFGLLVTDRSFVGYATASGLAFAAMFAYISGSPFVLEDIYRVSPQVFSVIFGSNAIGITVASQVSGRLVERVGPRRLLGAGLATSATGGVSLLAVVLLGGGLPFILPALFLVVSSVGLILPNATALALADHPRTAGSASALLGVLQYIVGGSVAPLVGIGGTGTAVPMAIVMCVLVLGASCTFLVLTRPVGTVRASSL